MLTDFTIRRHWYATKATLRVDRTRAEAWLTVTHNHLIVGQQMLSLRIHTDLDQPETATRWLSDRIERLHEHATQGVL